MDGGGREGGTDGSIHRFMDRMDGFNMEEWRVDGCMDGWRREGGMDGGVDGCMNGGMDVLRKE